MSRSLRARSQIFHGQDWYSAKALGQSILPGGSTADADIYVAQRGVAETVIPDLDDSVFRCVGVDPNAVREVQTTLFGAIGHDLWIEPTLAMEFQMYVRELIRCGSVFIQISFANAGPDEPDLLAGMNWLSADTMLKRRGTSPGYEHFASRRAFEDPGYVATGAETDSIWEFDEDQIFHLQWPLELPGRHRAPAAAAARTAASGGRLRRRMLQNSEASAYPDETYLPLARARAGAYRSALQDVKNESSRVKDLLFYPGAAEAEIFSWAEDVTDYFRAERTLRSRIALCELRDYLLGEFNRQVLSNWCRRNKWAPVELRLRPVLFTKQDWEDLAAEIRSGDADLDDVRAAVELEYIEGHRFGRTGSASIEASS